MKARDSFPPGHDTKIVMPDAKRILIKLRMSDGMVDVLADEEQRFLIALLEEYISKNG